MPTSLTQLLASNKKRPDRLPQSRIVASADETEIYIYDAIVADEETAYWWGGVSAEALVPAIRNIKGGTIHLRINSPGGDVFAAQTICQAIRDTGAKVIAHIDGYAASAATVISIAADEVEIAAGGFFMIHNAWTWAMGNANDLTATAVLLGKIDTSLAAQYAKKSGMAVDDVRAAGIDIPIVPGIMPIGSFSKLARFSDACGAEIPRWVRNKLASFGDDTASIKAFGLDVVTSLCEKLLAGGYEDGRQAPGGASSTGQASADAEQGAPGETSPGGEPGESTGTAGDDQDDPDTTRDED